jgi:hypothetical protein
LNEVGFSQGGGVSGPYSEGEVVGLGYGSDGTSWVHQKFDAPVVVDGYLTTESSHVLTRFAASPTEEGPQRVSYESEPMAIGGYGPLDQEIAQHLDVAPDGSVWLPTFDGLARFDGQSWTWYLRGNFIEDVGIASDGTVWVQANNAVDPRLEDGQDASIHTYVITPEAVAVTESQ